MSVRFAVSTALAMVMVAPAYASEVTAAPESPPLVSVQDRVTIYQLGYFASYAPSSALDIASRVPGFQLDLGPDNDGQEVRGFAGTAGNVVINGSRPSSKSESLRSILERIPARRVVRVEVRPGDIYGSDYAGKPQVLNIVLSEEGGLDGSVTAVMRHRYPDKWVPDLTTSALWKKGSWSVNASATTAIGNQQEEGFDRIYDLTGSTLEYRRKVNDIKQRSPSISVAVGHEIDANRSEHANIRYERDPYVLTQENHVIPTVGPDHHDSLVLDYFNTAFEVGGDITRPLSGGAIKFVGLATRKTRDNFDAYYGNDEQGVLVGGSEQDSKAKRNETIGRLSWSRSNLRGFSVELGAEYVYNSLDSQVALKRIEEDGSRTPIDLPIADATVTERRSQIYANVGRDLSKSFRADLNLAFEQSRLKVRGDADANRSLSFFKPGLTLDWHPGSGLHVQTSLKRTVAQLDFYDFVSSAELASDRVNGGNANLVPQRAWEARFSAEKSVLGDGSLKLELGYDRIDLLQDQILTEEGFDAPGNIGRGSRKFADATADLPLAFAGIKGARLKANLVLQDTNVTDPTTGRDRAFSGFWPKWQWNLDYRHDLGKFAYGWNVSDRAKFSYFRTKEIDSNMNAKPYVSAFVEYRPSARTTIGFDIDNLINTHGSRLRQFAFPSRASEISLFEFRDRNSHRNYALTLKHQFG
nr:hypothetical protein [uncultured Sphingomonas sp.]